MITSIVKTQNNRCVLVIKRCKTLGLNDHYKSYQILLPETYCQVRLVILSLSKFVKPINVHTNVLKYNLISIRDVPE